MGSPKTKVWHWALAAVIIYLTIAFGKFVWAYTELNFPGLRQARLSLFPDKVVYAVGGEWASALTFNGTPIHPASDLEPGSVVAHADRLLVLVQEKGDLANLEQIDEFLSNPVEIEQMVLDTGLPSKSIYVRFGLRMSLLPVFVRAQTIIVRPQSDLTVVHLSCVPIALVHLIEARPREVLSRLSQPCSEV